VRDAHAFGWRLCVIALTIIVLHWLLGAAV
jgi:hypothetical protein